MYSARTHNKNYIHIHFVLGIVRVPRTFRQRFDNLTSTSCSINSARLSNVWSMSGGTAWLTNTVFKDLIRFSCTATGTWTHPSIHTTHQRKKRKSHAQLNMYCRLWITAVSAAVFGFVSFRTEKRFLLAHRETLFSWTQTKKHCKKKKREKKTFVPR